MCAFMACRPNDFCVTMNKTVNTSVLLRSPQTTGIVTLDTKPLSASVPFMMMTLGSGEETTVVGWGRDRVVVVSLGECFVVIRVGSLVSLVAGMMSGVDTTEEPFDTTRWIFLR